MKTPAIDWILQRLSEAYSMEKGLAGHWAQIVCLASKAVRGLQNVKGIKICETGGQAGQSLQPLKPLAETL